MTSIEKNVCHLSKIWVGMTFVFEKFSSSSIPHLSTIFVNIFLAMKETELGINSYFRKVLIIGYLLELLKKMTQRFDLFFQIGFGYLHLHQAL